MSVATFALPKVKLFLILLELVPQIEVLVPILPHGGWLPRFHLNKQ